jgi:hypothetical protein
MKTTARTTTRTATARKTTRTTTARTTTRTTLVTDGDGDNDNNFEVSDKLQASAAILRGKSPGTQWTGGWVDPRPGLDDEERRKILA